MATDAGRPRVGVPAHRRAARRLCSGRPGRPGAVIPSLDGSGMVRGAAHDCGRSPESATCSPCAMHFPALGDYEMDNHVVEFDPGRRIGWEPAAGRGHPGDGVEARWGHRWSYALQPDGPDATHRRPRSTTARAVPQAAQASVDDGRLWLDAMAATLARLDEVVTAVR